VLAPGFDTFFSIRKVAEIKKLHEATTATTTQQQQQHQQQ